MAQGYISLKQILDDILEHPMLQDVSFERAVNHAVHFIRLVGMPDVFNEQTAKIDIKDYRGQLPCDLEDIIQVRQVCNNNRYNVFRYSGDSFHMSEDKSDSYDLTYKVQGNIIYTSLKEGKIEVAYRAFATDDEGYPMIPDNSSFITALEFYIKKKYFTIKFDQGKLNREVYQQVLQDYAFYVAQAQNDLVRPSLDQMETLMRSWTTLVPRVTEHRKGFVNNGVQERLRT